MLNINPSTRVFICTLAIDMRFSFDALSGLVTSHFGLNPMGGHIFVFFSRRRDRMKLLFWDADGFALFYKRLDRGTYSWIFDLNLEEDCEMDAADFAIVLNGINPRPKARNKTRRKSVIPDMAPLSLV